MPQKVNLDDQNLIKEVDKDNFAKDLESIPMQAAQAWSEVIKMVLPSYFMVANKVVILGMGGSAIAGEIIKDLAEVSSKIPIFIHRNYSVPRIVDNRTLVIGTSYSGNTEETLDAFKIAAARNAKLIALTTGGELEVLTRKFGTQLYKFSGPSQPRAGIGYPLFATLAILKKLGMVDITQKDIEQTLMLVRSYSEKLKPQTPTKRNPAKQLSQDLAGFIPVIYGSPSMAGVARRWKQDINENAKQAAFYEVLPEANHNALTGIEFPTDLQNKIYIIFLDSKFNHPRIKARIKVTADIYTNAGILNKTILIEPSGGPLSEAFQQVLLGSWTSFYLAVINKVNPATLKNVEELKKILSGKKF